MSQVCQRPMRLTICSCPLHLPIVRAALEKMCEAVGFDPDCTGKIILSADEALTNIIRHAYNGQDDRPIEIALEPLANGGGHGLRIRIRDYGQHVERDAIRGRDLEDVRPGGLGVHIMKHCMDKLEYAPAVGGGTVLTMTKSVRSRQKEEAT